MKILIQEIRNDIYHTWFCFGEIFAAFPYLFPCLEKSNKVVSEEALAVFCICLLPERLIQNLLQLK
jgi:hypothetical protein